MRSLKFRLGLGLLVSLTLVFLLLWLVSSYSIRLLVEENMATRLRHDAETLLAQSSFTTDGRLQLRDQYLSIIYSRPFSGHYYVITSGDQRLRSRSLWDEKLDFPQLTTGQHVRSHITGPRQQSLLLLVSAYQKQDRVLTIAVAEDLTGIEQYISRFQRWFGVIAVLILVTLIGIQLWIIRTSLRPLNRIARQVAELEQGKREQLDEQVPAELRLLIHEFNRLLRLFAQRLQRSRNALGDLAHALKKPLTVLVHLGRDTRLQAEAEIQKTLQDKTAEIQRSIDHVLKRARMAGEGPVFSVFTLDQDLPGLLDTLRKMYPDKRIHADIHTGSTQRLNVDREDMIELLGNLLDNACKWCRHEVRLTIRLEDRLYIQVDDDGPGIQDADLLESLKRGTRLDEKVQGHGLGLAIVRDMVQQYHGQLEMETSGTLRGLCVRITLHTDGGGNPA